MCEDLIEPGRSEPPGMRGLLLGLRGSAGTCLSLCQGPAPAERPPLTPRPGPALLRVLPWAVGGSPRCRSCWRTGLESSANGKWTACPPEEKGPALPGSQTVPGVG